MFKQNSDKKGVRQNRGKVTFIKCYYENQVARGYFRVLESLSGTKGEQAASSKKKLGGTSVGLVVNLSCRLLCQTMRCMTGTNRWFVVTAVKEDTPLLIRVLGCGSGEVREDWRERQFTQSTFRGFIEKYYWQQIYGSGWSHETPLFGGCAHTQEKDGNKIVFISKTLYFFSSNRARSPSLMRVAFLLQLYIGEADGCIEGNLKQNHDYYI